MVCLDRRDKPTPVSCRAQLRVNEIVRDLPDRRDACRWISGCSVELASAEGMPTQRVLVPFSIVVQHAVKEERFAYGIQTLQKTIK